MTGQQRSVPQSVRVLYLALYLVFLFAMNRLATGRWLPLTTSKGLWFYSGAAAVTLGCLPVLLCSWLARVTACGIVVGPRKISHIERHEHHGGLKNRAWARFSAPFFRSMAFPCR
jgi:hypothetical protein